MPSLRGSWLSLRLLKASNLVKYLDVACVCGREYHCACVIAVYFRLLVDSL